MQTSSNLHVLILGAGLAGLTLAQVLRKNKVSFEIFERDSAIESRFQGWAIALGPVLEDLKTDLPEDLPPISSANHLLPLDTQPEFAVFKPDGTEIARIEGGKNGLTVTRVNRGKLRNLLAQGIDIQWGKRVDRIEEREDKVILHFQDGSCATGDLLVGADGSHSQVRGHLFPGQDLLRQTPTCLISGQVSISRQQYDEQARVARSGYLVSGTGGLRFFVGLSQFEDDTASSATYYWLLARSDPEAENNPDYWTLKASKQELFDEALKATQDIDPRFVEIIHMTGPEGIMAPPVRFEDLILPDLPSGRRITLMGDAAHAMVPNGGQGGNNALQDAINLGMILSKPEESLLTGIEKYQQEMLERGRKAVRESWAAGQDAGTKTSDSWNRLAKR